MQTIKSGTTDQVLHFTADTGLLTAPGLSGFSVMRKRGSNAAAAMTLTAGDIVEDSATGIYALKLDEDMTITAGKRSELMSFVITAPGMATQLKQIELRANYDDDVISSINTVLAILGSPAASVSADIAAVAALVAALNNLSAATVKAQVVAALATDTYAEPSGLPLATDSLVKKLGFLYMALRNRIEVTATKKTFFDDALAARWAKILSDDGTTYREEEAGGP